MPVSRRTLSHSSTTFFRNASSCGAMLLKPGNFYQAGVYAWNAHREEKKGFLNVVE